MEKIDAFVKRLLESSTVEAPAWNLEAVIEKKPPKWNYIDGCMIKAILGLYDVNKDEEYLRFADDFIGYFVAEDGAIIGYDPEEYNSDSINEGKVLFDLFEHTGKEKYRKAIDRLYSQIKSQPRTKSGSFWHKKIYPNQIWLDGLYMVEPFYMRYEMQFNQKRGYKDIFLQFQNVRSFMRDKATGLFFHGYDESRESFWADKETGCSRHFWSRSLGWYAMALVDTIEQLDEQLFNEYSELQVHLRELLDSLLKFADEKTGMFYQVTDEGAREGNYLETSGSCAIAYALLKGARLGYLPEYYAKHGKRIFDSVMENKLEMGESGFVLKDICLVAGLGGMPGRGSYEVRDGSFDYYISEPRVENDAKGVAPFLFAYAETLMLK